MLVVGVHPNLREGHPTNGARIFLLLFSLFYCLRGPAVPLKIIDSVYGFIFTGVTLPVCPIALHTPSLFLSTYRVCCVSFPKSALFYSQRYVPAHHVYSYHLFPL